MNTLPASYYYVRPQVQPPPVQQQRQRRPSLPKKIKLKQPSFEIKTSMDLCNLYIKGIQPGLTSSELFNLFKSFGRIISARVMEDRNSSSSNEAVTKRGFGFVSFSTSLEAAKALIEMYVEPEKGKPKYENDAAPPVMIVRFHEPRVPRPEHNFSYQLALLSYSPLGSHFYTRQKNNMVPLQPMAEEEEFSFVPPPPPPPPPLPPTTSSYATVTSPTSPSYFPTTTLINNANFNSPIPTAPSPSYYYYPSYWTDNQGVLYSNYISTSPPLPATLLPVSPGYMTTQLHQNNGYSYSTSNKNQYHHLRHSSWYGYMPAAPENGKNTGTPSISNKLIKLLESECHITSAENPKLVKCLMKLSKTEQSNCLNNSVYFEKKVSDLMASCSNGKNNSSTNNSEEQEQEED
jgi:RNA recognition motif-containing protein